VEQHLVGVGAGGGVGSGAGAGEDLEAAVLGARHRLRRRLSQSSASAAARVRFWEAWSGTGRAVRWWPCPALPAPLLPSFVCLRRWESTCTAFLYFGHPSLVPPLSSFQFQPPRFVSLFG
jgi:hypothetical protein